MGTKDKLIQKTNDFSSVSKLSMCSTGYFQDDYMQYLVERRVRRAPLINRGYYVRMHAVRAILNSFVERARQISREDTGGTAFANVLILGAGYDTLFFRAGLADVKFVEVDYPDVMRNKANMTRAEEGLAGRLADLENGPPQENDMLILQSQLYSLIGMDLRNCETFPDMFARAGMDPKRPTLVISEVVLTYIDDAHVLDIMSCLSKLLPSAVFFNYEQIEPADPFGRFMLSHFRAQGSPLMNLKLYPQVESHVGRLRKCGWEVSKALSVSDYWTHFVAQSEKATIENLELFDESEEFFEKCRHYVVSLASTKDMEPAVRIFLVPSPPAKTAPQKLTCVAYPSTCALYGHAAECITLPSSSGVGRKLVVLVGGVTSGSEHTENAAKVSDDGSFCVSVFNLTPGIEAIWIPTARLHPSFRRPLVHSSACLYTREGDELLLLGGRTSPKDPNKKVFRICFDETPLRYVIRVTIRDHEAYGTTNGEPGFLRAAVTCLPAARDPEVFAFWSRVTSKDDYPSSSGALLDLESGCVYGLPVPAGTDLDRACPSISSWNSGVVVSGGIKHDVALDDVVSLSLRNPNNTTCCAHLQCDTTVLGRLSHSRFGHTAHIWNNKLVTIGGVSHERDPVPDVTVFDLESKQEWNFHLEFQSRDPSTDSPLESTMDPQIMLFNHSSILMKEFRTILVLGGGGNCFSFGTHFNRHNVIIDLDLLMTGCQSSLQSETVEENVSS